MEDEGRFPSISVFGLSCVFRMINTLVQIARRRIFLLELRLFPNPRNEPVLWSLMVLQKEIPDKLVLELYSDMMMEVW